MMKSTMNHYSRIFLLLFACTLAVVLPVAAAEPLTPASVLAASTADDWRRPAAENLLHLQLDSGEVVFELSLDFAPQHINNLRKLINSEYFDGLAIIRSQDNYVAQWGDPDAGTDKAKSQGHAANQLEPEFFRKLTGLDFAAIASRDAYADKVGFVKGFTVGADAPGSKNARAWLSHCYGALGVGRGMEANSGNAAELYVVTGHAPRHLDRNVTLIGRALSGMEHLSSLPRGTGTLGFYETPEEAVAIKSIRIGSDLPKDRQFNREVLRTDTMTFKNYVQSRTFRLDEWFLDSTGKIELCNIGVPTRPAN